MEQSRWVQSRVSELRLWQKLDALYHDTVTLKKKFSCLLRGKHDQAILSYQVLPNSPSPDDPPWVHKRVRRHMQHRQRAMLLLATPGFKDDLFNMARRWQLDTHRYQVHPLSFWDGELTGVWFWRTFLFWLSLKDYERNGDQFEAVRRQLARKYLADLDFGALQDGLKAVNPWRARDLFYQQLRELNRRYGLSALWDRSIEALLLSGMLPVPFENCRLVLQRRKEPRLFVEVFPETRKEDLDDLWSSSQVALDQAFPTRPKRRRQREQLDRDLTTQEHRRQGKGIWEIIDDEYDLDAHEGEFGSMADMNKAEELLALQLTTGLKRLTKAQLSALTVAVEPMLPVWVQQYEKESGEHFEEWYLRANR